MSTIDIANLDGQETHQSVDKLKESFLLLKKRLCLSHELIKQYSDKVRECELVSEELKICKDDAKKTKLQLNLTMTQITSLEKKNEAHEKKIQDLSITVEDRETRIAADRQYLEQLECKIKEMEAVQSMKPKIEAPLKEKIKSLEQELKAAKKSHELEMSKMESKLIKLELDKNSLRNKGTEVLQRSEVRDESKSDVRRKIETSDKSTVTDDFYSIKDDPYPLFCSKCREHLDPVPVDRILEQMSSCPALISEVLSPPKKHGTIEPSMISQEFNKSGCLQFRDINDTSSLMKNLNSTEVTSSEMERLQQRIIRLEKKQKKMKRKNRGCQCCNSPHSHNPYMGLYPSFPMPVEPTAMLHYPNRMSGFQGKHIRLNNRKRQWSNSFGRLNRSNGEVPRKKRRSCESVSDWHVDDIGESRVKDKKRSASRRSDSYPSNLPLNEKTSRRNNNSVGKFVKAMTPMERSSSQEPVRFTPNHSLDISDESENDISVGKFVKPMTPTERSSSQESVRFTPNHSSDILDESENDFSVGKFVKAMTPTERSSSQEAVRFAPNHSSDILDESENEFSELSVIESEVNDAREDRVASAAVTNESQTWQSRKEKQLSRKTRKQSLVSKLRNLKKSSNQVKCSISKTSAKKENNELVKNTPQRTRLEPLPQVNDFSIPKKRRIAHNPRQTDHVTSDTPMENSIEVGMTETSVELPNLENPVSITATENLVNVVTTTSSASESELFKVEGVCQSIRNEEGPASVKPVVVEPTAGSIPKKITLVRNKFNKTDLKNSIQNKSTAGQSIMNSSECSISVNTSQDEEPLCKRGNAAGLFPEATVKLSKFCDETSEKACDSDGATDYDSKKLVICTSQVSSPVSETQALDNETDLSETMDKAYENPEVVKCEKSPDIESSTLTCQNIDSNPKTVPQRIVRELRSRQIMSNNGKTGALEIIPKNDMTDPIPNDFGISPKDYLRHYVDEKSTCPQQNLSKKKMSGGKLQEQREKSVMEALNQLVQDESWSSETLVEIIERLKTFKPHTTVRCTINFLCDKAMEKEKLDSTYTPPAPLLTKTQQRVVTMLVTLNRTIPSIIELMQAGIEYRLFRLGYAPELLVIEELTRMFIAITRIQKDRERMRILCCDAIYCLGLKASTIIYIVLTSWSEVLPMAGTSNEPLITCLVYNIMNQQSVSGQYPKVIPLKKLLMSYYKYEAGAFNASALITEYLSILKEKYDNGLNTAIILLAKKEGPEWTYKNVVCHLLQMIIQKTHPSPYHAFSLLGHVLRSFPIEDAQGLVKNIIEQLVALLKSGEGCAEQQEGVATALLSLSRHKTTEVINTVLNWNSPQPLSQHTREQLKVLFDMHALHRWKKMLRAK